MGLHISDIRNDRPRLRKLIFALLTATFASVPLVAAAGPARAESAPAPVPASARSATTAVGGAVAGGYVLGASDGGVYNFGSHDFGSMGNTKLAKPIVGMAATPTGNGYWMVASDGGIFAFGDAAFYGSTGNIALRKPIVGMAATPNGKGYWFVAEDGGIFSFGDAAFYGSTGAITLVKPIVGMAATPTGAGYWMVASDGGIFSFGDARFYGSTGAIKLVKPIVDMAATPTGEGYWLVAEDGGIFTFGNAAFKGSTGGMRMNGKIVDLLPQGGDITAPRLHSLSFSPASVDTSTGPATFTIQARISDDLSGLRGASIWFSSPSGRQSFSVPFYGSNPVSGTALDGVFQPGMVPSLPTHSEQGTWRLSRFSMTDQVGNTVSLDGPVLQAAGFPATFEQTGAGDTTPPSLVGLSFTPTSVDTSAGPATFEIRAHIRDDVSGLRAASIWFRSPSGAQSFSVPFYGSSPVSGTALDGVFQPGMAATLPANSEPGTWRLERFSMTDEAGNTVSVDGAAASAAGFPTTFEQTGAGDTTPPSLVGLSFSPSSVDTSAGPATFEIRAHIRDDVSGLRAASIWFSSPSGGQTFSVPFYGSNPVSGTARDGVFEPGMAAVLPQHAEKGTWRLDRFSMTDQAGNMVTLTTDALRAAGFATTFEQTGG
jgi:hypothetical protein